MRDDEWNRLFADRQQLAVGRVINAPVLIAIGRTPRRSGALNLKGMWVRDDTGPCGHPNLAGVRAPAVLRVGRRSWSIAVELSPWSERATELVLRPTARRASGWSARRRARWYTAAHAAVDELRKLLATDERVSSERYRPAREPVPSDRRWSA
jgi:hypothetical protein